MGRAREVTGAAATDVAAGAPASSTVPQAWHSPQRPTHLRVLHPHSAHRNVVFAAFAMVATLAAAGDRPRRGRSGFSATHESYLRVMGNFR
ncbi:hypothetical protein GCM10009602_40170 [Nocardiopsis tropica]